MFFEIGKFPIFRKVDVFSTKMIIFKKFLNKLVWSSLFCHLPTISKWIKPKNEIGRFRIIGARF